MVASADVVSVAVVSVDVVVVGAGFSTGSLADSSVWPAVGSSLLGAASALTAAPSAEGSIDSDAFSVTVETSVVTSLSASTGVAFTSRVTAFGVSEGIDVAETGCSA